MKWISVSVVLFSLIACGRATDSFTLVCEAHYRADEMRQLSPVWMLRQVVAIPRGPIPEIARSLKVTEAEFEDFTLRLSNSGTGSVYVEVLDTHTRKQIVRHLWQFRRPPSDTFGETEQGFTGLIYVKHSETAAELQFLCKAGWEGKRK